MIADEPAGLHVHLLPANDTLRVALWLERYRDPDSYRKHGARGVHPGCDPARPPWMPPEAEALDFLVRLPKLTNGHPVALPGVIASWARGRAKWHDRQVDRGIFQVSGWALPIRLSLGPLRAFLLSYREALGEGFLAPQCRPLLDMLGELHRRLEEGPLLPVLCRPLAELEPSLHALDRYASARGPSTSTAAPARLGWAPPVPSLALLAWSDALRAFPWAGGLLPGDRHEEPRDCLDTRYPQRFARFVIDLCAAAVGPVEQGAGGPSERALEEALRGGDARMVELHRTYGGCLYPTHLLFAPPVPPPGSLFGSVQPATPTALAGGRGALVEASFRLELGLQQGRDDRLPIPTILRWQALRASLIESGDRTWCRPASILHRDWSVGASQLPWLFLRPELLADGTCALSGPDVDALTSRPMWKADRRSAQEFFAREGVDARTLRGAFDWFDVSLEAQQAVKLRVRWRLQQGIDGGKDEPFAQVRFAAELELLVGEMRFAVAEAERLLAEDAGKLLQVGGMLLDRQQLSDAVELARARQKVIAKLARGGSVSWGQALELEDQWLRDLEAARQESLFDEVWRQFLSRIEGGAGVPRLGAPPGFRGQLRPYQERGVSWMAFLAQHGLGGCLADDMGLGKTIQVLALLEHRRTTPRRGAPRCSLVVCPTAVVGNWRREASKFVPSMRVHVHQGPGRLLDKDRLSATIAGSDLTVTSYALLRHDWELLGSQPWDVLVVDEAQNIKNPVAKQTRLIKLLHSQARVALTGTPVENRLNDLWSIFDLLDPGLLGGPTRFARAFLGPIGRGDEEAFERLRRRVGPFLLRRTKRDPTVATDLPDKQEQEVSCSLTREQVALYQAVAEAVVEGLKDKQGIERRAHVLTALLHFKQICNHPESFEEERPGELVGRSGKLDRACELLEELLAEGQPTILFTQFVRMGELLSEAITERFNVEPLFYHGGLPARARDAIVEAFQDPSGPPIMIVSLKAGGVGLNLTRASAVIHYDRWWNPAVEDQATDRAHRIGQTQMVNVYKFVTQGTVEERVADLLEKKRALAGQVMAASAGESWLTEMDDSQLAELFSLDRSGEERDADG